MAKAMPLQRLTLKCLAAFVHGLQSCKHKASQPNGDLISWRGCREGGNEPWGPKGVGSEGEGGKKVRGSGIP